MYLKCFVIHGLLTYQAETCRLCKYLNFTVIHGLFTYQTIVY